MNPNTTLNSIRDLLQKHWDADSFGLRDPEVDELTDLIDALDKWITNGGFLPADWKEV